MRVFRRFGMEREQTKKQETLPKKAKPFRFELGWRGVFSLVTVCLCLFLWMFFLGLWAGQTILLPTADRNVERPGQVLAPSSSEAGKPLSNKQPAGPR